MRAAEVVLRPLRPRVVFEWEVMYESIVTSFVIWPFSSYSGEGVVAAPKFQSLRLEGLCGPFRRRPSAVRFPMNRDYEITRTRGVL